MVGIKRLFSDCKNMANSSENKKFYKEISIF